MAPIKKGTSSPKFKYRERDADSVKKRAEQDSGAFDSIFKSGIDTWRAKVGDNLIRFVPPTWEDPDHYGFDVWVHSYVGADNGSYLCPKKMLNKRCPLCEAQKEAADAGETEEAKQLKATKKVAAWIIDRDDDNPTPQIYLMSWTMDRDIAALCHNKRTGKVLMIDNPDNGYDLTLKRAGAGLKTRYFGQAIDRDPSPMMDDQKASNKVMEYVDDNPIPSTLAYKDIEYLEAVVDGTNVKADKDADEDDDKPSKRKRARDDDDDAADDGKPVKRKRAAAEDDDAEDEKPVKRRRASAEDDDADEEEKPSKRRASAEDDDDEKPVKRRRAEPEEDADDDEKPVKRRRASAEEDEEDEKPVKRKRAEPEEDEEDEKPVKRRRSEPEEDADDDEKPVKRRRAAEPEDDEADEKPVKRRRAEPEDDDAEDEKPVKRRRAEPEDDDADDEKPAKRRRADPDDDDDAAEEKPVKRRRSEPEEDEEEERPAKRRRAA
jgi:hypothetical protein